MATITYKGTYFSTKSTCHDLWQAGDFKGLEKHIKEVHKRHKECMEMMDQQLELYPNEKNHCEINGTMTSAQIAAAIEATKKKYGKKIGGLYKSMKIDAGWLVIALFQNGDVWEHWNYHPGRTELVLTHTTPYHAGSKLYEEFETTLAALSRLYAKDENA